MWLANCSLQPNSEFGEYLIVPCGSAGNESACNVGDLGSIPGLGRSPGEGKSYPLQYFSMENSVHGVAQSQTQLSDLAAAAASGHKAHIVLGAKRHEV